jgi:hypothetical protein
MIEISAATLKAGVTLLKRPLEDLYETAKENSKQKLAIWKSEANVKSLYKKIASIQNVKTIWQVEKEVNLKEFYYPSNIIVNDKRINISRLDGIP